MWKSCQLYPPAVFTPQDIYLVLFSVKKLIRAHSHNAEGRIMSMKNPNELVTFRLVAQCPKQLREHVSL
jgi:hypothetical protein